MVGKDLFVRAMYGYVIDRVGISSLVHHMSKKQWTNPPYVKKTQRNHCWGIDFLLEVVAQFLEPSTTYRPLLNDLP